MITRMAPTPSGYLHEGNLYNFLLNWLWARSRGGQVLLRIDDLDAARKRPEYVEDIFRVLEWLGLDWDAGPTGPDDFEKNWSQVQRRSLYEETLQSLSDQDLIFACDCSRSNLNPDAPYPGTCLHRNLPLHNNRYSWRIKMGPNFIQQWQDTCRGPVTVNIRETTGAFIVRRRDGLPAYHICSVTDDRYYGITHIARGIDLTESTAMQLYIDQHLPAPVFFKCRFHHHPLRLDNEGKKMSKSAGIQAYSIRSFSNRTDMLRGFAGWLRLQPQEVEQPADWIPVFKNLFSEETL